MLVYQRATAGETPTKKPPFKPFGSNLPGETLWVVVDFNLPPT